MDGSAIALAVAQHLLQPRGNLKIAKREELSLNTDVDFSCLQPSHLKLSTPAGSGLP